MKNLKQLVMEELEYYIEEGTANRGWYTCLKTGKKLRGEEARKQFEKQKQAEQHIREALEQEMAPNDSTDYQEPKEEVTVSSKVDPELGDMTYRLATHIAMRGNVKLVTIECCDCGAERKVKPQDVFQVKRCVPCQKKYRNARRAELRRLKKKMKISMWYSTV